MIIPNPLVVIGSEKFDSVLKNVLNQKELVVDSDEPYPVKKEIIAKYWD